MYGRKATINPPMKSTCTWILGHDLFRSWTDRANVDKYQGLLWIKGKPGSGKSTIIKVLSSKVSQQAEHENFSVATFYFSAKGTELERGRIGLLRSLLYQILRANKQYLKELVAIYEEKLLLDQTNDRPRPLKWYDLEQEVRWHATEQEVKWYATELEAYLSSIFQKPNCPRVVIFVGALDECDEVDAKDVAFFLRQLSSSAHSAGAALDICLSSRHFPSVTISRSAEIHNGAI